MDFIFEQMQQLRLSMQADTQNLIITINKNPLRSQNLYRMVMLEWALMLYFIYMFSSIIYSGVQYQIRIVTYCIVFLFFQKLELTYKYLEFEDPLHLNALTKCVRLVIYLCTLNLVVLLIRIIMQNQNIHSFMIFMHFLLIFVLFLNDLTKKNTKMDTNNDHGNIASKIITPMLLFIFNKTSQTSISEFLFIELLIFTTNMVATVEIEQILLLKQCQYFGWMTFQQSGKSKLNWNKQRALRTIIIICCVLIVSQNLLLMVDKIRFEISVSIWHTFAVAGLSYLLYGGYFPFKK